MRDLKEERIREARVRECGIESPTNFSSENKIEDPDCFIEKKGKSDFYVEMLLVGILGILLGIAIKSEALKRIAVGYDDYKMTISRQDYDIKKFQKDIIKERNEEMKKNSDPQKNEEDDLGNN